MRTLSRLLPLPLVLCLLLLATACGSGANAGGTSGGGTSSATATTAATATPQVHKVTVKAGDTSLCDLISLADFGKAVGGTVTHINKSSIAMPTGTIQENCFYMPPSIPGKGGGLIYAVTSGNGSDYYAMIKQSYVSRLNSMNELTGVGDAAFWGTSKSAPDAFTLGMLKDNVVVAISMDGGGADGSAFLPGAEQLAKEIASHL